MSLRTYRVISPNVDAAGTKRTWRETQEEAVKHAQALIEKKHRASGPKQRLFVVQVVQVVEEPPRTETVVRSPGEDDFKADDQEED